MLRPYHFDGQGSESSDSAGDSLKEGVVGGKAVFCVQPQVDGEGFRAFEVDAGFVLVLAVQIGPQG
jgi:hypothetical protein